MDALTPIHDPAVSAAVHDAYAVFARYHVSRQLEVCFCDCCMLEEVRQQIIDTPVRELSCALLTEYTNSAHGVPRNTDDMKALLPRYLDLIARDEEPDYSGVGTVLLRYGEALAGNPALFHAAERAALDAWARAMVAAVVRAEGMEAGITLCQCHLIEVLLAGGWQASLVTAALDEAFAAPHGPVALSSLAAHLERARGGSRSPAFLDLYALRHATDEAREALSRWLAAPAFAARLEAAILGAPANGVSEEGAVWMSTLHSWLSQGIRPEFPRPDRS